MELNPTTCGMILLFAKCWMRELCREGVYASTTEGVLVLKCWDWQVRGTNILNVIIKNIYDWHRLLRRS
jgi:hypothetical protein